MKFRQCTAVLICVYSVIYGSVYGQRCFNHTMFAGGPSPCGCTAGVTSFNAATGNKFIAVKDLEVWGGVGDMPLVWRRYANSRFGAPKTSYGDAHFWTSSFVYAMRDVGVNGEGRARIELRSPEGQLVMFTQSAKDPNVWKAPPSISQELHQDGNNYSLQTADGYHYRFEKLTSSTGHPFYRLQDIADPYQNKYTLKYSDHKLIEVTEPAGRYLKISYGVVNGEKIITKVEASDGRSVGYHYAVMDDGLSKWVALDTVYYGDGTKAIYEYSQSEPGAKPLLSHSIDPRIEGVGTNMRYTYFDNIEGFIQEERNGITGAVLSTFIGGSVNNTVCYPNGKLEVFNLPTAQRGNVNSHTDGLGRKTAYTYGGDGLGFLEKVEDALGRITEYNKKTIYDNPLEITHPDGTKEKWTRDDLDLVLTYTDGLNRVTTFHRDAHHRISQIDYPDGTSESFTYNDFGQVITHTLKNKGLETNSYDNRGLKILFVDALGDSTKYAYNEFDRLASITDPRKHTSAYEYDERGLPVKTTDANGTFKRYEYDPFGNPTKTTDELGHHPVNAKYDEFKRAVTLTDALGRVTKYTYDLPGACGCSHTKNKPTKIALPSGKATEMEYDVEWEKIRETEGAGTADAATTFYQYDAVGKLVTIIDPNGKEWRSEYDNRDRKIAAIDPLGNKTEWQYNAVGNVVRTTRPDSGVTENQYDAMDRLTKTTDPKQQVTEMTYDAEGNMATLKDPKANVYSFEYDLLNRKTKMIYPDGLVEAYKYDAVGNLITYTARAGQVRTYVYDNRNRETNCSWTSPWPYDFTPAVAKTYDAAGRLTSITSSVSKLTYAYDDANELTAETQKLTGGDGTKKISYSYDVDGLRKTMTYPGGTILTYSYTARNQVAGIANENKKIVTYAYDYNGNRTTKTLENGTATNYVYDAANRMLGIDNLKGTTSFARFDYGYDKVDRRTYVKRDNSNGDVYGYDAIDQVANVQYDAASPEMASLRGAIRKVHYDWDANGNRTTVTDTAAATHYTSNNMNQYTQVGSHSLAYYRNANLKTFDGWKYAYDAQSRLIKAVSSTTTIAFAYDGLNRCVKRVINGVNTYFYYDGWELIEERSGVALVVNYVHGATIDEILKKITGPESVYYHMDAACNVVRLTDLAGNVVEKYSYDIFGKPTIKNYNGDTLKSSAFNNHFLFAAREYLKELGLYDYRNRMYTDALGRFLQIDPIRFEATDYNLYRYVFNNSINKIDPLGLIIFPPNFVGPLRPCDARSSPRGPVGNGGEPKGLPPGRWRWAPDQNNPRKGTWVDDNQKGRNASWDDSPSGRGGNSGKAHWDINDGKGNRTKVDENGSPVSDSEAHPSGRTQQPSGPTTTPIVPTMAPQLGPTGVSPVSEPIPEFPFFEWVFP